MKLGLIAFVVWSLASITGTMAQCTGTQMCASTIAGGTPATFTCTFQVVNNGSGSTQAQVAGLTYTHSGGGSTAATTVAAAFGPAPSGRLAGYVGTGNLSGTLTAFNTAQFSGDTVLFTSTTNGPLATIPNSGRVTCVLTTAGTPGVSLTTLLTNNMVCVKNANVGQAGNAWYNQEYHQSGGTLIDYKKGPSDTVDPQKTVGTWAIGTGPTDCEVTYNYTAGNLTFRYNIYVNGSNYCFQQIPPTIGSPTFFSIPASQVLTGGPQSCGAP